MLTSLGAPPVDLPFPPPSRAPSFNVVVSRLTCPVAVMRTPQSPSLLSPSNYDNDAASLRSPSEQDSDSEDDEFLRHPRSTLELAQHDQSVLEDEDELEKLLTRRGAAHGLRRIFSPNGSSVRIGKKERRRARREARQARRERVSEEGELMYEMEEGFGNDDSLMSGSSSDMDRDGKEAYIYEPVSLGGPGLSCLRANCCLYSNSHQSRHGRSYCLSLLSSLFSSASSF